MAVGNNNGDKDPRHALALVVCILSISAALLLSIIVIACNCKENAQFVITAILPLIGTWVGTVLAFYFSRDNFEAANRAALRLHSQMTSQEKLASIPVAQQMIKKDDILSKLETAKTTLAQLLKDMTKGDRLPIFNSSNHPRFIVHRSAIQGFISQRALAGDDQATLSALTLQGLLAESNLNQLFSTSFSTVSESATLADAKSEMERTPKCQDIFVTADGTRNSEARGWITNNIIEKNAKL
jgi:hypothetical protein